MFWHTAGRMIANTCTFVFWPLKTGVLKRQMHFIDPEIIRVIRKQQMLNCRLQNNSFSFLSGRKRSRPITEFKNSIKMGFLTTKTEIMLPNSHSKSYKKKIPKEKKRKRKKAHE